MEQQFVMGMIAGFFIGIVFTMFFTSIVTKRVIAVILSHKNKKDNSNGEPADWWKSEDYDPRQYEEP